MKRQFTKYPSGYIKSSVSISEQMGHGVDVFDEVSDMLDFGFNRSDILDYLDNLMSEGNITVEQYRILKEQVIYEA